MEANTTGANAESARPSSLVGPAIVLASVALSVASHGLLAETVRIRWTVGTYRHYGPEYVSTLPVLVAFPVLAAALYVGARWLESRLKRDDAINEFDEFDAIYDGCILVMLGTVVAVQVSIVVLNAWPR